MILLSLELLSLLTTLALALLWIVNPTQNIEPYTIISGLVFGATEWLRRRTNLIRETQHQSIYAAGQGGRGGNAKVDGSGIAIGGIGGRGGSPGSGSGGAGGNAEVKGNGLAMGGEGGEAGQIDRGGNGGRSPLEILGIPNRQLPDGRWLWGFGCGGDGTSPEDDNSKSRKEAENERATK